MISLKVFQDEVIKHFFCFSRECPILSVFKGGCVPLFCLKLWLSFLLLDMPGRNSPGKPLTPVLFEVWESSFFTNIVTMETLSLGPWSFKDVIILKATSGRSPVLAPLSLEKLCLGHTWIQAVRFCSFQILIAKNLSQDGFQKYLI